MNLGNFWTNRTEGSQTKQAGDITWSIRSLGKPSDLGFGSALDQRHHFIATFPRAFPILFLRLLPRIPLRGWAGFDNVRVSATTTCQFTQSFSDFEYTAERRIAARIVVALYNSFNKRKSHCLRNFIPWATVDLIERFDNEKATCA